MVVVVMWSGRFDDDISRKTTLLKEQLKQLENQNNSLNNQIVALQRHITTLQEQNSSLHTQTALTRDPTPDKRMTMRASPGNIGALGEISDWCPANIYTQVVMHPQ
ncbi:unnamed protein product [Pleuronectes platessa]|uniref:Uncharacterized protein n=1 Tax=Pleuronectes platessa TaxID=8262 RepID=A0A9N7Z070_PLEPL|nr:unnamed protein product [Pleuronectes platessa]